MAGQPQDIHNHRGRPTMTSIQGPQTPAAIATFQQKYCQSGEAFRDVCNRVAAPIADCPNHYYAFRNTLLDMRFVPGGRILAAVGSSKRVTPYSCFVSGTINDALNGPGSIMDRLAQGAATMQMGGGIGYDFSTIRPRGDKVRSMEGRASGPVSYIKVFNQMGETISSAGERRGAQMGILRVDHPDIEEFIHAKQNNTALGCFNLSIAVTDKFMEAVKEDGSFDLQFEGRVYRTIKARVLWEAIMRGTWDWAEPGVIFIDRVNGENNLGYCETIAATNPCSEQPLPPHGACLLGSFNLVKYLKPMAKPSPLNGGRYWFNWALFMEDIPIVVRAMDNVIDVALYPLPEQKNEAQQTRRMGLGVMGLANCIEAQGMPYGTPEFINATERVIEVLKNTAYIASATIAREKRAFPRFTAEYMERPFIQDLSKGARNAIGLWGIRNSHLISIAPTGTLSFCMDNVSSGIEPVFSPRAKRNVLVDGEMKQYEVVDYGTAVLGVSSRPSDEITAEEHVGVLTAAQKHVDSSIAKTCNVPSTMPWDEFKGVYLKAWEGGAKGCATFQDGGMREGVLKKEKPQLTECKGGRCVA